MKHFLMLFGAMLLIGASAPRYSGHWFIAGTVAPEHEIVFEKGKPTEVARLIPVRLFIVDQDAVVERGFTAHPRGRLMVPVDASLRKFCGLERHLGSAFACLSDDDSDGRFETYFSAQVFKEYFFGSVGSDGGFEKLKTPVSLTEVDGRYAAPRIPFEFSYEGSSKKGEIYYRLCTSKSGSVIYGRVRKNLSRYCFGSYRTAKLSPYPFEIEIPGGAIVVLATDKVSMKARLRFSDAPVEFTTESNFR